MPNKMTDAKRVKLGRGLGSKDTWEPWLQNTDFTGPSRKHGMPSILYNRELHAFSTYEANFLRILEMADKIEEFREQVNLDLNKTTLISSRLGVKHIKYKGKNVVVTTDVVITFIDGSRKAISIKPESELNDIRTLEKLQVEMTYWLEEGVEWLILTEKDIPVILAYNINLIRGHFFQTFPETELVFELLKSKKWGDIQLNNVMREIGIELKITAAKVWKIFKHLCSKKRIRFNYYEPFSDTSKFSIFQFI